MTDFNVGPGIAQSLHDNNDEPRSDEMYLTPEVSQTIGRDAMYYYLKEDNTVRRLPFDGAT